MKIWRLNRFLLKLLLEVGARQSRKRSPGTNYFLGTVLPEKANYFFKRSSEFPKNSTFCFMERVKRSYLNHASHLKRQISLSRVIKTSTQTLRRRKTGKKIINRKYFTLVLNREVYNIQLLFTLINFYRIFHYWHKPTWKLLISFGVKSKLIGKSSRSEFFWEKY